MEIKNNIKYIIGKDERNPYKILKPVLDKDNALVVGSDKAILINEVLKYDYNIQDLHISNDRLFPSLIGLPMKKSLPQSIYSKIDSL